MSKRSKIECDKAAIDNTFVENHAKLLKEKCVQFDKCIDNLYTQANGVVISSNKDVNLKPICSDVQASSVVCNVNGTQKIVREFLNQQLRNLNCGCRELNEPPTDAGRLSIPLVIGANVCGFLLLATLFVVCFIWYRRKILKKKSHPSPGGYSKYGAADVNNEDHNVYYQIDDKEVPPTLPQRNVTHNQSNSQQIDEPDYLVPVVGNNQLMGKPDYEVPEVNRVQSSQYSTPYFDETEDSGYFIPLPPTDDEEGRQVSEIKT